MVRHFKGSRSIGFWCYQILGLERDQQADDPVERQTTAVRVLKERLTGRGVGEVSYTLYDRETGMLKEVDGPPKSSGGFGFVDETSQKTGSHF